MITIYLVRHGEYENPDYLFPGRLPGFPLSDRGREQVEKLATYFENRAIVALYSSPLLRTRQTAEMFSKRLNLPIVFDDRLLEVITMAEGVSMKLFDDTNGELSYTPEYLAKGAETMQQLADRLGGFVEEKRKKHEGKEVLVVTHGDPMRYVVMKYMGMSIEFDASRSVAIPLAGGYKLEFTDLGSISVKPIVI